MTPRISQLEIDPANRVVTAFDSHGRGFVLIGPESYALPPAEFRWLRVDVSSKDCTIGLPGGEVATVEGPSATNRESKSPIVYLDQNVWSRLSAIRVGRDARVPPTEKNAGLELIEMAERGEVRLPFSAGRAVETNAMHGERRIEVASTMIMLSRGWAMAEPVQVRGWELRRSIWSDDSWDEAVITPFDYTRLFGEPLLLPNLDETEGDYAAALKRMVSVVSVFDVMLEPEAIESTETAERMAQIWADSLGRLATHGLEIGATPEELMTMTEAHLLSDLRNEIAAAAFERDLDDITTWLQGVRHNFSELPYLGCLLRTTYHRLRNGKQKWDANNLFDLHFLCCAYGYADFVVAERNMVAYLNQQSGAEERASSSLARLLALLES